jgi:hypothetical protein
MKLSDFGVEITRVQNGFVCRYPQSNEVREYFETTVFSDDDADEIKSAEELIYWLINYFGIGGSRYDAARLTIERVPGDKHEPPAQDVKETG